MMSKNIYKEELLPWLPNKVIDCHVHIGKSEHVTPATPERKAGNWALEVATSFSWEELRSAFDLLLPEQQVSSLAFGFPYQEVDIELNNEYVLSGARKPENNARVLALTRPEWGSDAVEALLESGFVGIKPYPDLAPGGSNEVSIYDFLPKSHLNVLDNHKGLLMLHLPRKGRLADSGNIREILEIRQSFPSIKLIIAHIGRSFCLPSAKSGLPHFVDDPGIYFDTAANLNSDVFQYTLQTIGPDRLLFGSDLPIMLMRGVREHVGDNYINYTDGSYSWNTNRKSPDVEAKYTYYIYEEMLALIKALKCSGFGEEAAEKLFYSNCANLIPAACENRR